MNKTIDYLWHATSSDIAHLAQLNHVAILKAKIFDYETLHTNNAINYNLNRADWPFVLEQ